MKYKLTLDNQHYITSYGMVQNGEEQGVIVDRIPSISNIEELCSYQYIDGEYVFDSAEYAELIKQTETSTSISSLQDKIKKLETELASSDYKIIKSYEQSLVGVECEYDILALHAERQAIRDQINELQVQEAML